MITFLLITLLLISIGLNVALFILIKNQLSKINVYENWILEFKTDVSKTFAEMETLDKTGVFATSLNDKGIFQTDDQVGQIFQEMKALIEKLNQRAQ